MTYKNFLISNFLVVLLLITATEPSLKFFHKGLLSDYETYIEIPFILLLSSLASAIIIWVHRELFNSWFRKFLVWYFPTTLLLTFLFPTTGYVLPHRYDMAVFFGSVMVLVTIVFMVYSLYKNKKTPV